VKTVFVVFGQCGEYSDAREWAVIAYSNEATAVAHAARATERAKEIDVEKHAAISAGNYDWERAKNRWDPHMELSYTGTDYVVGRVEFSEAAEPAEPQP
jgi:hypothetical protein